MVTGGCGRAAVGMGVWVWVIYGCVSVGVGLWVCWLWGVFGECLAYVGVEDR